jgi:hypothetical protein
MHRLALAVLDGSARFEDATELAKLARVGSKILLGEHDPITLPAKEPSEGSHG